MNRADDFDRLIETWLASEAPPMPAGLHDAAIDGVRVHRQRVRWLARLRWLGLMPVVPRAVRYSSLAFVTVALALLLALVLATVASHRRVPPPFGPASNGSLLYDRDGDIYVAEPGGPGELLRVGGPTDDGAPAWSRDGTRFAFIRRDVDGIRLVVANAAGDSIERITPMPIRAIGQFEWSPDGRRIAFFHEPTEGPSISVAETDGGGGVRMLDLGGVEPAGFVTWRPPSSGELVFLGHPRGVEGELGLYTIHVDGSGLTEVASRQDESAGQPGSPPNAALYTFQTLSISADGSTAVFSNWEGDDRAARDASIRLLDLTTGQDRVVMSDGTAAGELRPALSPDGATIIFERVDEDGNAQVMVAPIEGGANARSVGPRFPFQRAHDFSISPDGTRAILILDGELWLMDLSTGAVKSAEQRPTNLPSWQRRAP